MFFEGLNVKSNGGSAAALEIDNGVGNNIIFMQSAAASANETSGLDQDADRLSDDDRGHGACGQQQPGRKSAE